MAMFQAKRPASLKLCSFLDKPYRRDVPVKVDYLGITVPSKFVVGYGMDLDQEHRYLPDLWVMEDDGSSPWTAEPHRLYLEKAVRRSGLRRNPE